MVVNCKYQRQPCPDNIRVSTQRSGGANVILRVVQGCLSLAFCLGESWLKERDMPNVAPNELHKDSVVRFCVPAHRVQCRRT